MIVCDATTAQMKNSCKSKGVEFPPDLVWSKNDRGEETLADLDASSVDALHQWVNTHGGKLSRHEADCDFYLDNLSKVMKAVNKAPTANKMSAAVHLAEAVVAGWLKTAEEMPPIARQKELSSLRDWFTAQLDPKNPQGLLKGTHVAAHFRQVFHVANAGVKKRMEEAQNATREL